LCCGVPPKASLRAGGTHRIVTQNRKGGVSSNEVNAISSCKRLRHALSGKYGQHPDCPERKQNQGHRTGGGTLKLRVIVQGQNTRGWKHINGFQEKKIAGCALAAELDESKTEKLRG